jgi:anti-sigma factor RsiW
MYEGGSGERYTIYCSKVDVVQTAFRYEDNTNFGSVRWIEGNFGWALSGPKDRDRLKSIASAAYDQIENRPPPTSRSEADQLLSRRGS